MGELKEIDINNYAVIKQLNIEQYNRIIRLKKLGFKEEVLGEFRLKHYSFDLNFLEKGISESAINHVVMELSSPTPNSRTCFNCKLSTVCFAYKELKEILAKLPVNIHGNDAPLNQIGVFDSLAGCCLVYEENN